MGVVKSQSSKDLVYSCRLAADGAFGCCTQNLRPCGGLRGALCKHLLVLIVGLAVGHSTLGEQLILRRLDVSSLPTTRFGGQKSTERLIRVTWHLVSTAFLVLAAATASCAAMGPSEACRGVGRVTGASFASFRIESR